MNLVADVLDQQVFDCRQRRCGKVDGITLEIRDGEPPRVAYIEMSVQALARRIARGLARHVRGEMFRLPWSAVDRVDVSVHVNVDARDYPGAFATEEWLRDHIIARIPGNAHHKHQESGD